MSNKDPKLIVLQFNECINQQDIEGLSNLMTKEHVFIDSSDDVYEGKESMVKGWIEFFSFISGLCESFFDCRIEK